MYEDDPQDLIFDILGETIFPDHPLGRAMIGARRGRRRVPRAPSCARFHRERYAPGNDRDRRGRDGRPRPARRGVGGDPPALSRARSAPATPPPPAPTAPGLRFRVRDTEQYHLCLGGPAIARDDERRFALRVLDAILGGTSSSRLFQAVREQRGLAYSVFSFHGLYAATGQIGALRRHAPGEPRRAVGEVLAEELARIRAEPVERRGARARQGQRQGARSCSRWSRPRRGWSVSAGACSPACRSSSSTRRSSASRRSTPDTVGELAASF